MELIIINKSKLKIMLSADDMKKYGIDHVNIADDSFKVHTAFKNILSEIELETEFNTAEDRIFIQLYPSKDGGCEMFVSKMNHLSEEGNGKETAAMPTYKEQGIVQLKTAKRSANSKKDTLTYCFEKIEWLICACRELSKRGFSGESFAYKDKEGRYYLFISPVFKESEKSGIPFDFLSEFGDAENTDCTALYINENGKCICGENAVETLCDL